MINASQYAETETLRNGLEVCFRASRPDDIERIVDAFKELDPDSIYLRFFGPKKEISPAEIKRFQETDFINRVILLCTTMHDDKEIVIASGTYVLDGEGAAEVAFIVEEDFHRLGIAGRLMKHLGRIAVAAGVKAFIAEVLPRNNAMLNVFERCGWPMTTKTSEGTVHVWLDLTACKD
ncbi:MAG TPA: GNAT family N-acetyltransferase [Rhodocyclaceae bacterium]|nr:GNAT family N-acetyltransferase [Rhodocyclaceae bacterium]